MFIMLEFCVAGFVILSVASTIMMCL